MYITEASYDTCHTREVYRTILLSGHEIGGMSWVGDSVVAKHYQYPFLPLLYSVMLLKCDLIENI